jgi:hypothetical protein
MQSIDINIEDSGKAFDFYRQLINTLYPDIKYRIATASGGGNIGTALRKYYKQDIYDRCIVVYDSGADINALLSIERAIKKFFIKYPERLKKLVTFTPACFEETLFSFSELKTLINIDGSTNTADFDTLKNIISSGDTGAYSSYTKDLVKTYKTVENAFEDKLANITRLTNYTWNHDNAKIEIDCWINNCCYKNPADDCNYLPIENQPGYIGSKLDLIARRSLLLGFVNILDDIIGIKFRRLNSINEKLANYFVTYYN